MLALPAEARVLARPESPSSARPGTPVRGREFLRLAAPDHQLTCTYCTGDIEMTIFTTSPTDTGGILAPEIVDTAVLRYDEPTVVIDLGDDGTRRMPDYLAIAPISPIPRRHTDEHAAIEIPDTIGIYPPPAPGVGRHALTERVGVYPVVRPSLPLHGGVRSERRAAARRDRRARAASVLVLAVLAATVLVLAVAW